MKGDKKARILELERKLMEAEAGLVHLYHAADANIDKARTEIMLGSGVIITITALGGRRIVEPTMIRDGLSDETVAAIRKDLVRSFELATTFKPRGVLKAKES